MFGLKKVLSFTMYDTYDNIRSITDAFILGCIRYSGDCERNTISRPTYTSTIRLSLRGLWDNFRLPHAGIDDGVDMLHYRVKVYKCSGNRRSTLSPSQNILYDAVIATKTAEESLSQLQQFTSVAPVINANISEKDEEEKENIETEQYEKTKKHIGPPHEVIYLKEVNNR